MPFVDHHCVAAAGDLVPTSLHDWNDGVKCDEEVAAAIQSSCPEVFLEAAPSDPAGCRTGDLRWAVAPYQHWPLWCWRWSCASNDSSVSSLVLPEMTWTLQGMSAMNE